ncbi:hypothetical protein LJC21_04330, partial [Bacteroides sp. OttesenSCG-928-E20]|nr:hypothetical protein [Bacteroides sp. OttesenSCG-928-E20]
LVVSVHRDDSLPALSQNYHSWKQVDNRTPNLEKQRWTPEYEGHIVMGQLIPITENLNSIEYDRVNADMGIVSKDICYIRGQVKPDNEEILFHTKNIQGTQAVLI